LNDVKVTKIQLPINSVILSSTSTHVPMVEYVGERQAIRYVPEDEADLAPCLAKMAEEKRLFAGYDFQGDVPALKNISTTGADVIFTDEYGYEKAINISRDSFGNKPSVVLMREDQEADPIGKIEWIELVASLFNRENAADGVVSNIKARYLCHAESVKVGRNTSLIPATKPKVIWLKYGILSSITCPSSLYWQCDVLAAAGAELLYFPNGLNATTFRPYALNASAMIFPDANFLQPYYSPTFYNADMQAALAGTDLVVNKKIFDILGKPLNDWFESAIAEPDVVLLDLIQALYGDTTLITGTRKRVFLRNVLVTAEAVPPVLLNAQNCSDESVPRFTNWLQSPCTDVGGPLATIPGTHGATIPKTIAGVCADTSSTTKLMMSIHSVVVIAMGVFFMM
jgi:hypothetical protein